MERCDFAGFVLKRETCTIEGYARSRRSDEQKARREEFFRYLEERRLGFGSFSIGQTDGYIVDTLGLPIH